MTESSTKRLYKLGIRTLSDIERFMEHAIRRELEREESFQRMRKRACLPALQPLNLSKDRMFH